MMTNPHRPRAFGGKGAAKDALLPEALYDLAADVGETTDVIGKYPEAAARLRALAKRMRDDIGDSATNQKGKNRRRVGRVPASGQ
jgi:peptide subunit release factor 1 (eRF1)